MPVKFWHTSLRFWFFLSYLITTVSTRFDEHKQCKFWFLSLYFKLAILYSPILYHLGFVLENSLHAKLVQSLVNLYEFISGQNDENYSDDDILLPKNLENDLLLCLTKMRAHNYNIEVLENDSTLVLKGQKEPKGYLLKL